MTRADPGLSHQATTLEAALGLLAPALRVDLAGGLDASVEAADAIESAALPAGLRPRRVILDAGWWREPGLPMIARVAERRRVARGPTPAPNPSLAAGNGWVALVAHPYDGYRMRAIDPAAGSAVEWRVGAAVAERLAPFAFTFHDRFPRRALGALDIARFAFAQGRGDLALLVGAGLLAALVGLLTPAATGWLIDRAIPAADAHSIVAVIAGLGLAGACLVALEAVRTIAILRFEARIAVAMQAAIVDRVASAPARFFRGFSSGDLALRMGSVNTVQRAITGSTIGTFVTSLFLFANLALMVAYSPALSLAASGIVALVVAVTTLFGRARLRLGAPIEALDGALCALTYEIFAGIAKLRAGAAEPRAFERWHRKYAQYRDANGAAARLSNWESVLLSLLQPAAMILVLWLAWRLSARSAMTTGDFVAFYAALFGLLGGVRALVSTALELVNLKPLWDRARPILETPPEDAGAGGERLEPAGAIALESVSFAYPDGPRVLHDIELAIRPGEFVAIVGASGSGKSTLLRVLLGFERPERGTIRYDGRDLAGLDVRHLRRRIGTVLQDGRLWAGDILTNIVGAADVSAEGAMEAARRAGLAADIEAMPMGIYTLVGEGLSTLSGGQRQRILIARALVARPPILFLDEATSALDNVSQAAVMEGLARLAATRVVIAHRLNTVRHADRIVVLDGGRIVEQGTFRELAARPGAFASLLARQVA